jgi:hypothetical protein
MWQGQRGKPILYIRNDASDVLTRHRQGNRSRAAPIDMGDLYRPVGLGDGGYVSQPHSTKWAWDQHSLHLLDSICRGGDFKRDPLLYAIQHDTREHIPRIELLERLTHLKGG